MESVYNNIHKPGSFGGVESLQRYSGRSRKDAKKFLASQDTYTMHKPRRVNFQRRKTYSKGIGDLFQIDLADLSQIASFNKGNRYLLTCIDVFSKRAWAIPIRKKTARVVTEAFEKILQDERCNMVQSDKGTEFINSTFQSMLQHHRIKFYTSENEDIKAAVVERFNRTLKDKMFRYFTHKNTRRYVDVLDNILHAYNNSYHRSIGMAPMQVNKDNEGEVRARLYPVKPKSFKWKYDVGDRVRMVMQRQPFHKGYLGHWSEELFEIVTRFQTSPVTYSLQDLLAEPIKGRFYEHEIQKVLKSDSDQFRVERVVKTRRNNGKIHYFVKWKGYPRKFNSWVDKLEK